MLEDISLDLSDHIQGLVRPSFSSCWDQIGAENQIEETMVLSQSNTVQEAINQLITFLSMTPCEKTNVVCRIIYSVISVFYTTNSNTVRTTIRIRTTVPTLL